jgi:hypothetical protein
MGEEWQGYLSESAQLQLRLRQTLLLLDASLTAEPMTTQQMMEQHRGLRFFGRPMQILTAWRLAE